MRRLLAIGLDAADLGLVERLVAKGRLPHVGAVLRRGTTARLTHPLPYRAELPWTSFLTGRQPAETGYWGTVRYDPASYVAAGTGAYVADPFYALKGIPVVAFDVPHAVLSPRVEGIQVTAWGAHSPQYPRASRPAGLVDELDRVVGAHPAFDADSQPGWWSEPYLTALTAALLDGARRRAAAMVRLLERQPGWRLAITVFSEPHSAGHHLWHGVDPAHPLHGHAGAPAASARLEAVYRGVDDAVGRVVAAAGEEATVVLFAVHGIRANGGDLLALHLGPELLHRDEHGWARVRNPRRPLLDGGWVEPSRRRHAYDVVAAGLVGHRGRDPARRPDLLDRLASVARRARPRYEVARHHLGRVPWYQIDPAAPPEATLGLGEEAFAPALRPFDYLGTSLYERYWPCQRSFALPSFSDLHLRVNLMGREGRGRVARGGFGAELDRLERLLGECRDARTGAAAVAQFVRMPRSSPRASTCGPEVAAPPGRGEGAPADLVVLAAGPVDALEHPRLGRIGPLPFLRTGEHGAEGWVAVAGPAGPPRLPGDLHLTDLGKVLRDLALETARPGLGDR